jgi:hypothetical protein
MDFPSYSCLAAHLRDNGIVANIVANSDIRAKRAPHSSRQHQIFRNRNKEQQ